MNGVSAVSVNGGTEFGASVSYDPTLLRQVGVEPAALAVAIREARMVQALGTERLGASKREVVLRDQPNALEELEALPIRGRGSRVFRLGELAQVRPEEDTRGQFYRVNGNTALALELFGAQPLAVPFGFLGVPGPTTTCGVCAVIHPIAVHFVPSFAGSASFPFAVPGTATLVGFQFTLFSGGPRCDLLGLVPRTVAGLHEG